MGTVSVCKATVKVKLYLVICKMPSRGPRTQQTLYKGSFNYVYFMSLRMSGSVIQSVPFELYLRLMELNTLLSNFRLISPSGCPIPIPWPVFLGLFHGRLSSPTLSYETLLPPNTTSSRARSWAPTTLCTCLQHNS